MCDQQSLRSACAYAQSDQSLCYSLDYSMNIKLLTEHHFEFLSLKMSCTSSSESIHGKMPHCWKSHVAAHIYNVKVHLAGVLCDQACNLLILVGLYWQILCFSLVTLGWKNTLHVLSCQPRVTVM